MHTDRCLTFKQVECCALPATHASVVWDSSYAQSQTVIMPLQVLQLSRANSEVGKRTAGYGLRGAALSLSSGPLSAALFTGP